MCSFFLLPNPAGIIHVDKFPLAQEQNWCSVPATSLASFLPFQLLSSHSSSSQQNLGVSSAADTIPCSAPHARRVCGRALMESNVHTSVLSTNQQWRMGNESTPSPRIEHKTS